ncbi:hypothetical protein Cgig2_026394 [Carnegiea gigantea]|uniref:Endonuclease/exonuclease/phosphatase domain-containing protein n=1 Tax=Carnegiea gigantea TaxID=171969 RepID=A0A9Q1K2P4_9CARY|nr:hypothetical protein Cgig2_026394 [Carnegiea gigantea]
MNYEQQRQQLWEDLKTISHQVTEAWCILGDFNAILYKEDRKDTETREMAEFIEYGELHEMRWHGPYYSWTNKTYEVFDFTHNQYLVNGLSDHSPMLIQFPPSIKPKKKFQFCEMWCKHPDFQKLADSLKTVMSKLQTLLSRLHKDNYAYSKAQQELARGELTRIQLLLQDDPLNSKTIHAEKEARNKYISILSSSMALIK